MKRPNIFTEYSKPTVELVLKLLADAYKDEDKLDKILKDISEEVLAEVVEQVKEMVVANRLDLSQKIDLSTHPAIYTALKAIERKEWQRFTEYVWIACNVIEESMVRAYKTTSVETYKLFTPAIKKLTTSPGYDYTIHKPDPLKVKIQITDTNIKRDVLPIPWCQDGKVYSQRLYHNVAQFEEKLSYVLEQGIAQGKGMDWMKWAWRELTGSSAYNTARLLKTETVAMWSQATKESYLNMGIEYVEIVGDAECGGICLDYVDGEPIPLEGASLGIDLPPYHPNCACSYVAWVEEAPEEEEIDEEE